VADISKRARDLTRVRRFFVNGGLRASARRSRARLGIPPSGLQNLNLLEQNFILLEQNQNLSQQLNRLTR